MGTVKTIDIWADTRGRGVCRGCGKAMEWAEVVASGKKMPFDAPIVALTTLHDPTTHRVIEGVDLSTNHWGSCPAREQFRRRA